LNLTDLRQALKRYGFDDSDPLDTWINAALHQIESRADWRFLQMTASGIAITTGQNVVTAPSDFLRPYKLRDTTEETGSGGVGYDLEYWNPSRFDREVENEHYLGKPEVFTVWNNNILIWPVADTSRTFSLYYQRFLADLVNETDEPAIPLKFHYNIVLGAAYIALQAENEEDRAETAQGQFESNMADMVASYDSAQIGEPEQVEDVMDYAYSGTW
jgi:hypothetical protein